ncbi:hypothetical protein K469DRAFT_688838 [Zopfia rhizophila CBS 207.26]|uniref:Uncharacterized protein n=1 Tax=Zopfia rhizophila CBS 207.26 TaxID=1314779 RepID=A0A6A6E1B2_9PEZI|nr:hypothetical protein K469DRAFT_688838 [Zopfia rhizophila CBS 207.26]
MLVKVDRVHCLHRLAGPGIAYHGIGRCELLPQPPASVPQPQALHPIVVKSASPSTAASPLFNFITTLRSALPLRATALFFRATRQIFEEMGLLVWRAPSPEESTDAIKVDLTAPARSPIRRRRVNGSPFAVAGRRARRSGNAHATLSGSLQRSPRLSDNDFLLSAWNAHATPRFPPPPVPESRHYSRSGDPGRDRADEPPSRDHGRAEGERYYPSLHRAPLQSSGGISRISRDLPAFTPNFASAAASRDAPAENRPENNGGSGFRSRPRSPYRRLGDRMRSFWADSAPLGRDDNIVIVEDREDDSSDNNAVGFPPLRRMGHRTIADGPLPSSSLRESWSPATTLDGLGDRERSLSPVDDHWDTMLSTVAPDPLAPTADSSFTSAAASASFSNSHPSSRAGSSNSNSASSSRTHLTVPSRRHSPDELLVHVCDTSDDTASDTEEEDMEVRPHHISSVGRLSHLSRLPGTADEPLSRNPNRYSRDVHDRSRDASAFVRNYYSSARIESREQSQPEQPLSAHLSIAGDDESQTLDQELRDARAILERLTRRDDVSDEFWASVGLTRPLADRVERLHEHERL